MAKKILIIGLVLNFLIPGIVCGMDATELDTLRTEGVRIIVIDIRSASDYRSGHIPGAMHIPYSALSQKRLPALGRVVVCGSLWQTEELRLAVEDLNRREGITAEALKGGIEAWRRASLADSGGKGLQRMRADALEYRELERLLVSDSSVILVDLRKPKASAGENALADFRERFPGARIIRSSLPESGLPANVMAPLRSGERIVLIDSGDGTSQEFLYRVRAAGPANVSVLLGGERALTSRGEPVPSTRRHSVGGAP